MRIPAGERFWGVLGYLPLLGLVISRWVKRDSIFVQFHARQGGVLFALWAVLVVLAAVLLFFIGSSDFVTQVIFWVLGAASVLYLGLMVIGLFKAGIGERFRMPVVADVALALKL